MKYCISGRQPKSILEKADEIIIKFNDFGQMIEYMVNWPNKNFILEVPKDVEVEWDKIQELSKENNLYLKLEDLNMAKECLQRSIKYFWKYPITSWYELDGILKLRPSYIFLGAPLSFCLEAVSKKTDLPIRLCPNLAYDAYIPRMNGLYGSWIRPEDVETYEEYVNVLDFEAETLREERALYHVYAENKYWPGNLNLLFKNFNINVDNRAIPEEIGKRRMNCSQRCMSAGTCHFCETAIKFSNAIRKKHYNDLKDKYKRIIPDKEEMPDITPEDLI